MRMEQELYDKETTWRYLRPYLTCKSSLGLHPTSVRYLKIFGKVWHLPSSRSQSRKKICIMYKTGTMVFKYTHLCSATWATPPNLKYTHLCVWFVIPWGCLPAHSQQRHPFAQKETRITTVGMQRGISSHSVLKSVKTLWKHRKTLVLKPRLCAQGKTIPNSLGS
jgi:hypothetical protein